MLARLSTTEHVPIAEGTSLGRNTSSSELELIGVRPRPVGRARQGTERVAPNRSQKFSIIVERAQRARVCGFKRAGEGLPSWPLPFVQSALATRRRSGVESSNTIAVFGPFQRAEVIERTDGVVVAGAPMILHGEPREGVVLGAVFVAEGAVDKVDDVVDFVIREAAQGLSLRSIAHLFWQLFADLGDRVPQSLHLDEAIDIVARAARIENFLTSRLDIDDISRQGAARIPQIDLKDQRVLPWSELQHPLQRRVGDSAAVPVILTVDLYCGKARRQRATRHDMGRAEFVRRAIEIDEVSAPDVDGTDAEPQRASIDEIEIHKALKGMTQCRSVVPAGGGGAAWRGEKRRRQRGAKNPGAPAMMAVCALA